ERVDVTRFAASEAVVVPETGAHVETRAALVMEGAEALQRAHARGLEADVFADDVGDVGAGLDLLDVALSNPARHGSHPSSLARRGSRPSPLHQALVPGEGGLVGEARDLVDDHALACGVVAGGTPVLGETRIEVP